MARQQTDHLFKLVKALTKAEKRNFRLYVKRIGGDVDTKFLTLFGLIDKQTEYSEEEILKKAKNISPSQLPNLKANLTKNLLISLRLMAQQSDVDIMLRQQIDYARILYNKALYRQSLIMLEKAKVMAKKEQRELLYFEMVEFEKLIESQFITRSIASRADDLTEESDKLNSRLTLAGTLSNLSIRLYSFYLSKGYIRNEEDQIEITDFFHCNLPTLNLDELGFSEKLYLYQSHVWYFLIMQDFKMVYRYSLKWVELFKGTPGAIGSQTDLYIKGFNNMLDGLYFIGDYNRFKKALDEIAQLKDASDVRLTKNSELLLYKDYYTHIINWHFMEGTFTDGVVVVPEIVDFIKQNEIYLDNHVVLVLYYKIACLYFGSGDSKNTVKYLNQIINYKDPNLRSDIQCFSRILNLLAHYEMQNYELMDYLIKTTYRFLAKMEELHRTQKHMLVFLRRLSGTNETKLDASFRELLGELKELRKDPYEKRPFLYLDIISWLESKISDVPVQDVIRQKRLTGKFEI